MSEKVIVGISGGVDSSVAALLLKQQGYDVEALFMKNWDEQGTDGSCLWEADVEDAMLVCDKLDIPLNTVDLSQEYWNDVFSNFLEEYRQGRTPNPDVLCNQEIKFKAFLEHATKLGAQKIATGHYARIVSDDSGFSLCKGVDNNKDQSYFLCRLDQQQLGKTLFPVGELDKPQVRALASHADFVTQNKKDSTGICFIGERPFRDFLSQYISIQKGDIKTTEGEIVGEHDGTFFYTLGQRQGLGIGGVRNSKEGPWYVVDKDMENNVLIVAQGHNNPYLFKHSLQASNMHWIKQAPTSLPHTCTAKTRYRQADQACQIESVKENAVTVRFDEAQRAVTPGQYVVFYDNDACIGSGIIENTF